MLGTLEAGLRFCSPFLVGADKQAGALQHLEPAFYTSQAHRLAGGARERSLAGSLPAEAVPGLYPFVSPDRPEGEAPHFVAEAFFLTQARSVLAPLTAGALLPSACTRPGRPRWRS